MTDLQEIPLPAPHRLVRFIWLTLAGLTLAAFIHVGSELAFLLNSARLLALNPAPLANESFARASHTSPETPWAASKNAKQDTG